MKRILITLLIALPIGVVLTPVLFFVAAVLEGMGPHYQPLSGVIFPFGRILNDVGVQTGLMSTDGWQYLTLAALFIQYPLYSILIAISNSTRQRGVMGSLAILVVHSIAAIASVTLHLWW